MLEKSDIPSIKSIASDCAQLKNLGINRYNTVKIIMDKTDTAETILYKVQKASELPLFSTASNLVLIARHPVETNQNHEEVEIDSLDEVLENLTEKFANKANNINSKIIIIKNSEEEKSATISYPVSKTVYEITFEKTEDHEAILALECTKGNQEVTLEVIYNQDNQIQNFTWCEYEQSATAPGYFSGSPVSFLPSEESLHGDNDPNIIIKCLGEVFNQVSEPFAI